MDWMKTIVEYISPTDLVLLIVIFWLMKQNTSLHNQNKTLVHEFFANNTVSIRLMTLLEGMVDDK